MNYLFCAFLLLLTGCQSSQEKITHFDGQSMTMSYRVMVGKRLSDREKNQIQLAIDDNFYLINQIFNRFNPDSELSRLNALEAKQRMTMSEELSDLLRLTDHMVHLTQGKFDPTVWSIQAIWKDHLEKGILPEPGALKEQTRAVGWHKIHLEGQEVWKEETLTKLDLSGIAKGHGIDLLVENLNQMGYRDVYVEWGGEIRVSGQHPEKRRWTIAITPPLNPESLLDTAFLAGEGVATSGDYLQYWTVGKETYTHIIDPIDMKPLKRVRGRIVSVTVRAPTCAMADALATAGMLFPSVEETKAWAENLDDVTFWIQTR